MIWDLLTDLTKFLRSPKQILLLLAQLLQDLHLLLAQLLVRFSRHLGRLERIDAHLEKELSTLREVLSKIELDEANKNGKLLINEESGRKAKNHVQEKEFITRVKDSLIRLCQMVGLGSSKKRGKR